MAELPRVKVHEDGTVAVRQPGDNHWSIPGRRHWFTDEQVSGPDWRDAAVVPYDVLVAAIADAIGKGVDAEAAGDQVDPHAMAQSLARSLRAAAWTEPWAERQAEVAERNAALHDALAEDAAHLAEVEAEMAAGFAAEARAFTAGPPTRSQCAWCGRSIALRKDGLLRQHQAYLAGPNARTDVDFPPLCEGTGKPPAPYRHSNGQPCHGCQICLDDGEAVQP